MHTLLGQRADEATIARLRLGVGGWASNHGDLAPLVRHNQVLDRGVHPDLVVHQQRRHAWNLDPQADARQTMVALHECGALVCRHVVADGMCADEQGIHVVRAHEVEHETLGMLQLDAQHAARDGHEVQALLACLALCSYQHLLLKLVVIGVGQKPQTRPPTRKTSLRLSH